MKLRIVSFSAFALNVLANFIMILACPDGLSRRFLFFYSASSLVFSFFGTIVYSSARSRILDLIIVVVSFASLAISMIDFRGVAGSAALYALAAAVMILAEFSAAQTGRFWDLVIQRFGAAIAATLVIYDFDLSILLRTVWLAVSFVHSTRSKNYIHTGGFRPNGYRFFYSALTSFLYFGSLNVINIFNFSKNRELYVIFSIIGSLILKFQDYMIKEEVLGRSIASTSGLYFRLFATFIAVFGISVLLDIRVLFFMPVFIALVMCERMIHVARWN